jgi:uncharacterized protein YyaL (SSP411 family)
VAVISCKNPNRLINEKSPYLLQHAYNPVDWYPWGDEAFSKAKREDKPIFLSIGYSACHWCHVMEKESFEDETVAETLNNSFVSIKVDREERPDVDNVYMRVCQAFTGGGGWPTSIFMTAEQKPFFAGTYFPQMKFLNLLYSIGLYWVEDRAALLNQGERAADALINSQSFSQAPENAPIEAAVSSLRLSFDSEYGGFGYAPKFPTPHILYLLLKTAPDMAEKTLVQMYKGGIFDHIGFGFSRYSTDRYWLVPHFEKMLYDNALITTAYLMAFESTGKELYRTVAEKTLHYMQRELLSAEGGFFSSQDADSEGVEGKYYVFRPEELTQLLGETDGLRFNEYFGITERGNFEGQNIPNLIKNSKPDSSIDSLLPMVYEYRKSRTSLRTDNKILTSWNALALAAFADAYRIIGEQKYLNTALQTYDFIERELTDGDTVYSGVTSGKRAGLGLLDDYSFFIYSLIRLHQATLDDKYISRAQALLSKAISEFFDHENGGFFFSGNSNEKLIFNPKETYDGALPSGNSVMAYNLSRLFVLTNSDAILDVIKKQEAFMNAASGEHPPGNCFYLYAMLPTKEIVCALKDKSDLDKVRVKSDWIFKLSNDSAHPLLKDRTTFYECSGGTCLPPTNDLPE